MILLSQHLCLFELYQKLSVRKLAVRLYMQHCVTRSDDLPSNMFSRLSPVIRVAVAAAVGAKDLFQVGFEVVEQLQHDFGGVLAGVAGGSEVVIDAAGEGPDRIDPAGPPGKVEEGAVAAGIQPLRQEIEYIFLVGEDVGAAAAAAAGRTAGEGGLAAAEGVGKDAAAEPVGDTVEEGDPAPVVLPCPLGPDDPPLEPFDFALYYPESVVW